MPKQHNKGWLSWLLDKNTRHGRGIRTALQVLYAVVTFFAGFLAIPGFADFLYTLDEAVWETGLITPASFAVWVGIVAYIQNAIEDAWKSTKG